MIDPSKAIKLIEWDSAFFGKKIARLYAPEAFTNEAIFDNHCKTQAFEQVQACIKSDDKNNALSLGNLGFELVDSKLTMSCNITNTHYKPDPDISISTEADIPQLLKICHGSFNHISRYNWKGFLSQDHISAFYDTWLVNGVRGKHDDFCFHYQQNNKIVGFTTITARDKTVNIGIIAVAKESRGMGIADKLMDNVFAYATSHQLSSVTSVTQGKNTPTQHLYRKHGMEVSLSESWYYKIIGEVV